MNETIEIEKETSIRIPNKESYKYLLIHNKEEEYVRIVYNKVKKDTMKIKKTGIPITEAQMKNIKTKATYMPRINNLGVPTGSYIFKRFKPEDYEIIVKWIEHMFIDVFSPQAIPEKHIPNLFDFM